MTALSAAQAAADVTAAAPVGHRLAVFAVTTAIYLACLAAAACCWRWRGRDQKRRSPDDDSR